MSTRQYFEENGYVVLTGALPQEELQRLTQHMFDLHKQGKMVKDDQCPESDAIYGDPEFENILAAFAKPIGDTVGRELIPTYTYARIYRPGEILKKHKDRPSCEISATLTLGYDGKYIWPIYFDEEKEVQVDLEPGDLAIYKGCEVAHWRKPFKGNWHVQVFLHYVDANGPYKDQAYDGRPALGLDASTKNLQTNDKNTEEVNFAPWSYNGVFIPSGDNNFPGFISLNSQSNPQLMFTPDECDRLINQFYDAYPQPARIGGNNGLGGLNREVRTAQIFDVALNDENKWIFDKVALIVATTNAGHFGYEISGISHSLQLIRYDTSEDIAGHYNWHIDAGEGDFSRRKISLTVQLSDPSEYKGCDLEVMNHGQNILAPKEKGAVNLFPSYMPHRVTSIEEGVRYSLVIWVHGSRRFQ